MVFSRHLLGKTAFVNLEDITTDLPPLSEEAIGMERVRCSTEAILASPRKSWRSPGWTWKVGSRLMVFCASP